MFSLANRTALVTGGGRGIGRAIALALAQAGAKVIVAARTTAELDEVVGAIRVAGGRAEGVGIDVTRPEAPADLLIGLAELEPFGPIDILVNNAGIGSSADPRPVAEFDDTFWDLTLLLNLTVPYRLSKAALPHMRKQRWGRIINVASINSKIASLHGAAYTASKHGLLGLTRTLALEVASEGITVNAICPGPVHTVMNDRRLEYDARRRGISFAEIEKGLTPIGGRLEPEDVAPLAVYFASDEARMVTGQAYNVDGGVLMAC